MFWLLVSGDAEEAGYVAGGWGGQMLWRAELFGDFRLRHIKNKGVRQSHAS